MQSSLRPTLWIMMLVGGLLAQPACTTDSDNPGGDVAPSAAGSAGAGGDAGAAGSTGGSSHAVAGAAGASAGQAGDAGAAGVGGVAGAAGAAGFGDAGAFGESGAAGSGTAGSAGSGTAGTAGSGGTGCGGNVCGTVTGGPAMTMLSAGFCIDGTEVTRSQYEEWLLTNPPTTGQPSSCAANTDFTPTCEWPPGEQPGHPVVCVDWCDAYAYCKAVGKRLCGKIGGGANAFDAFVNASRSQWFAACSSGGQCDYTYGDEPASSACNGSDAGYGATVMVASLESCQSPSSGYGGVYDLTGNAAEWEDSCESESADANCRVRGGSFEAPAAALRCDDALVRPRTTQDASIGFRCCS